VHSAIENCNPSGPTPTQRARPRTSPLARQVFDSAFHAAKVALR
jgi:hypothetical protein